MVETRLEELVLDEHPPVVGQGVVRLFQALLEPVLALHKIRLAGVIGTVGEPQAEECRISLAHDLNALQHVGQRLSAHRRIPVPEAAQFVLGILKNIGVDPPDANAPIIRFLLQPIEVVHLVPGDVQGHRRAHPGHLVHLGGVGQPLVHVAGGPGLFEDAEAGAGVAVSPGGRLDLLTFQLLLQRGDIYSLALEIIRQRIELFLQRFLRNSHDLASFFYIGHRFDLSMLNTSRKRAE